MKEVNIENGKIVLKNLKNLLHLEYINYKVPKAENATIPITAPNVPEYSFVCWTGVASHGFLKSCYIDTPDTPNANIWFTQSTTDIGDDQYASAYALYVKD
jgi:hypothetical protein